MTRFLGFLLGLALILGIVGWAAGWWRVRTEHQGDEHTVRVEVDGAEIKRDLHDAQGAVEGAAKDLAGKESTGNAKDSIGNAKDSIGKERLEVRGEVRAKDTAGLSLALPDGTTKRFEFADDVEVLERTAKVGLSAVDVGDRLAIFYDERDGNRWARRIVLDSTSSG